MQEIIKTLDENKLGVKEGEEVDVFRLQNMGEEPPVVKFVNLMIAKAVSEGPRTSMSSPKSIRSISVSVLTGSSPAVHAAQAVPRGHHFAHQDHGEPDIAEHRKPQDGRIQMELLNRRVDIRVSFLPTVYGETW